MKNIRNYVYGAHEPTNVELVRDQILRAHRYGNTLVEIELGRRKKYRELMAAHDTVAPFAAAVAAQEAVIEAARDMIRQYRQKTRAGKVPDELVRAAKHAIAEMRPLRLSLKAAKASVKEDVELKAQIEKINRDSNEIVKAARAASGLYWGTYLVREAAADQQRGAKGDPSFKPWRGEGQVAVQLQGGMSTTDLFVQNTRAWIEPMPVNLPAGTGKRPYMHTKLHLRVQSDEKRDPIWAVIPIMLHRPLPAGVVKWVFLRQFRVGPRVRWSVMFNIELDEALPEPKTPSEGTGSVAAIDVGWRLLEGGALRVAMLVDEAGKQTELVLPEVMIGGVKKADELGKVISQIMDSMKLRLIGWLSTLDEKYTQEHADTLPTADRISKWHRASRVSELVAKHKERLGDALVSALESDLKQHRHIWSWQAHAREKFMHRRDALQQEWAKKIVGSYTKLIIEDFNLSDVAKRNEPEGAPERDKRPDQGQRHIANVSGLMWWLKNAARKVGCVIEERKGAWTTMQCHECTAVDEAYRDHSEIRHTCSSCGAEWDQDVNACLNMLRTAPGESVTERGMQKEQFSKRQTRMRMKKPEGAAVATP